MSIYSAIAENSAVPVDDFSALMQCAMPHCDIAELGKRIHEAAIHRAEQNIGAQLSFGELSAQDAVRALQELQQRSAKTVAISSNEALNNLFDRLSSPQDDYLRTEYAELDNILGHGLDKHGLYILAARPSIGKSTVALNIAERVSERNNTVLYISLEMPEKQITDRRASIVSRIPFQCFSSREFASQTNPKWEKMYNTAQFLSEKPFYVVDKPCTLDDIERHMRSINGLTLAIVDHIGLITCKSTSQYEKMTAISGRLKQIALSTGVPILALSQLNRASEQRESKRPIMADLRDSGSVEQDADGVILLYRDLDGDEGNDSTIDLAVAKNRHGRLGALKLKFDGATATVSE